MIKKIGKHEIEVYDDIQQIPMGKFQKFNKYSMISNEIGNTFADYDNRTMKALEFLDKGMINEAKQEIANRRQTVFNAFNEKSPTGKAFSCLIKRIDDVEYNGISPAELDLVEDHLNRIGLSYVNSIETLNDVKKNSRFSLKRIFQMIFKVVRRSPKTSSN